MKMDINEFRPLALNDLKRPCASMREELLAAFARVLDRGWFVQGPELEAFEREFAAYCGAKNAVGVANGTDAIELALRALGIGPGDEVIVAPNAGMYTTTALVAIGAVPVYADVEERHLNLDPAAADAAVTPRTRAIVATHLYGRMANVEALREVCSRRGLVLLEDCAQAHGARHAGKRAGTFGDAAAFSFYPTKILGALGDAGMIVCGNDETAARLRRLRQYGWDAKYHSIEASARNSRLDELQAAVLREQLPLLDARNARRRQIAERYAHVRHPAITAPDAGGDDYVAHLYVVRTPQRDALRTHLKSFGIASDVHYPILDCDQPALRGRVERAALPIATRACNEVLSLPCFPELEDAEVERVCEALACWEPA